MGAMAPLTPPPFPPGLPPPQNCVLSQYIHFQNIDTFITLYTFSAWFFLLKIIESILCILKLKWEKAVYKVGLSFHLEQEILKNLIVHSFMAVLSLVLLLEK